MSKPWRNPREIVVHLAPAEPENSKRAARLLALLATGIERSMQAQNTSLDFTANVSPNTRNVNDPLKTENL